jgi:UDPglucose 6-dehydrogenase
MIKMHISVIGAGYVGLVTGACLAEIGNDVTCVDIDKGKVDSINRGETPIFEEGLGDIVGKNVAAKRLKATMDLGAAVAGTEMTFICVGTPSKSDGSTDLKHVESAAKGIGRQLSSKKNYHVIVMKSTVPPKTCEMAAALIEKESGKKAGKDFGVASNPEFLREGKAVEDFMKPDRIVIGAADEKSFEAVKRLYANFSCPVVKADLRTAEMVKYASNAFLATKVSFANEIGNICKKLGIDVYDVMDAIGMDKRIGRSFLNAGIGYGGSCFPKDVRSLIAVAKEAGIEPRILNSSMQTNESQPLRIVELVRSRLGSLSGRKITVLGLAFKPDTDDMREAPSIKVINRLVEEGALVKAYDPAATENAKRLIKKIEFAKSLEEALGFSEVVLILTEWKEFGKEQLYRGKTVFDGRRVLRRKSGGDYEGVCW